MSATSDLQHKDVIGVSGKDRTVSAISWVIVAWICYIFLGSLPYKFSSHPDTVHIFSTIGEWMKGILGSTMGELFANYGAYGVGCIELLTSILLLTPIIYWLKNRAQAGARVAWFRARIHAIGGALASMVMIGAVFFHLFTPLGIEVLHEGESDGGSLFRAALSIVILGVVMFVMNWPRGFQSRPR